MKSNRIASIIIESNRELGESFQAYPKCSAHVPYTIFISSGFFLDFFSKYSPNYNKLHNYRESIFSLHSTLLKFLPVPMLPPPNWKRYLEY